MLTINDLIKRMKKRLPDAVFRAINVDFYIEVLMDETLPLFSSYYPKIIKGIVVNQDMAIEVEDFQGIRNRFTRYAIPLVDEMYPYTGVSVFHYPRNYLGGGTFTTPSALDANVSRVIGSTSPAHVTFTHTFEGPNIIEISPSPKSHMNFTVDMYQMRKPEEIKDGLHETFKKLFEYDCKIALYYKFYEAADGGMFGGVELKDYIGTFIDKESDRETLIEEMESDFYKDPDRYSEIFNFTDLVP